MSHNSKPHFVPFAGGTAAVSQHEPLAATATTWATTWLMTRRRDDVGSDARATLDPGQPALLVVGGPAHQPVGNKDNRRAVDPT